MLRCYTVFIFGTLGVLIGYNLATSKLVRDYRMAGYDAGTADNSRAHDADAFQPNMVGMATQETGEATQGTGVETQSSEGELQTTGMETQETEVATQETGVAMQVINEKISEVTNQNIQDTEGSVDTTPAQPDLKSTSPLQCFNKVEASSTFNKTYSGKILRETVDIIHSNNLKASNEACERRHPSCILIGVPKAGARVLLDFMQLNPYIETYYSSTSYEMPYFTKFYDLPKNWLRQQMPCSYSNQVTVMKMASYFHDRLVPERIRKFNRDMKLILIVREPVERLISVFTSGNVCRDVRLFSRFDENVEASMDLIMLRRFMDMSIYDDSMKVWMKYFNLSQILIIESNELKLHPGPVLNRVEDFLGLENYIKANMFVFNSEKGFYCIRSSLTSTGMACYDQYRGRTYEPVPADTFTKLKKYFKQSNENFFDLIGKYYKW